MRELKDPCLFVRVLRSGRGRRLNQPRKASPPAGTPPSSPNTVTEQVWRLGGMTTTGRLRGTVPGPATPLGHHPTPSPRANRIGNGPYIRPPIRGSFVNLSFIAAPNFSWDTLRVSWDSSPSVGRSPAAYSCNFSCVPSGLSRMHLYGNQILRRVRAASSRRPPRHRRDTCSMAWRCRFLTTRRSTRHTG